MNELTVSAERLEWLRSVCLALPEASEKVTWGDPTWRVKDKIFAMQKGNYAGGRAALWLKGERGAQEALVGADPGLFFVPPYVGHKGWIGIWLDGRRLPREAIAELVGESFRLVAPVRLTARLREPGSAPAPRAASRAQAKGGRTRRATPPKPRAKPAKSRATPSKRRAERPAKASAKTGKARKKRGAASKLA